LTGHCDQQTHKPACVNADSLHVLSLNVCGLRSKDKNLDFINYINKFDIIGFQETKLDSLDTVNIEGFTLYFKHRKDIAQKKSGGIAIAINNNISKYVKIIETECKLLFWLSISKHLTMQEDIILGVVYIPPENSQYSVDDPFLILTLKLI